MSLITIAAFNAEHENMVLVDVDVSVSSPVSEDIEARAQRESLEDWTYESKETS